VVITANFSDFKAKNERPDSEAMKAKHSQHLRERTNKHNARKLSRLRLQHAIYQQLTPEQQPKYLKMMAKEMGKRMGHRKSRERKHDGHDD